MYTTIIHPLRKMYHLSINEYCILEAVKNLAHNVKYNGWCVLSAPKLALALDLDESTVRRGFKKLEEINLIVKRRETEQDTAVRTSDEWNEWFMPEKAEILLGMKTNTQEIVGHIKKPETPEYTPGKLNTPPGTLPPPPGKLPGNTNKDTNKDIINSSKEELKASPSTYGDEDINKTLEAIRLKVGVDDFSDASKWKRIYGKHCFNLLSKIGSQEFSRRLDIILNDSFKHKRCNELKYIYEQVKAFIEPLNTSIKSF